MCGALLQQQRIEAERKDAHLAFANATVFALHTHAASIFVAALGQLRDGGGGSGLVSQA
jgi:hypothetical protein